MSALARYFMSHGKKVAGYDKTSTALTDELIRDGMTVSFSDDPDAIPSDFNLKNIKENNLLVVYTPAIPATHRGLNYFRQQGIPVLKRSEVLGMITRDSFTVAVAGTHGKTTTSSMIAHMLTFAGKNCTAFLGGITKNYDTNYLPGDPAGSHAIVVVEADEYDRSFLTLSPDISVITSMDPDHLDIYGDKKYMEESYRLFASKLKSGGKLIFRDGLPLSDLKLDHKKYSITGRGDCNGAGIFIKDHRYHFDYVENGHTIRDLYSDLPGLHNVENAIAAITVAMILGLNEKMIRESLKSYTGVRRRFDIQIKSDRLVFIDDYAHHPEELRACISSVRELYPGKKILGIFQPHLFSRTRDFADGFAQSLGLLDEVILLDIYPARETPIPGVDSAMIAKKIKNIKSTLCTRDKVLELLELEEFDVLLTLGAGDIDQLVEPIRKRLSSTQFQSIEDDK